MWPCGVGCIIFVAVVVVADFCVSCEIVGDCMCVCLVSLACFVLFHLSGWLCRFSDVVWRLRCMGIDDHVRVVWRVGVVLWSFQDDVRCGEG